MDGSRDYTATLKVTKYINFTVYVHLWLWLHVFTVFLELPGVSVCDLHERGEYHDLPGAKLNRWHHYKHLPVPRQTWGDH